MAKPTALPVPPALARKGVRSISTNLPEGHQVDVSSAFVKYFGDEAVAVLLKGKSPDKASHG